MRMCNLEMCSFICHMFIIQMLFLLVQIQLASKSPPLGAVSVSHHEAIMRLSGKASAVLQN